MQQATVAACRPSAIQHTSIRNECSRTCVWVWRESVL